MSPTRFSQQPLQVYEDPVSTYDHAPMPSAQNSSQIKKQAPLRQIKAAASRRSSIVFNPPQNGGVRQSPFKSAQQSSSSPSRAPFANKLNAISMPPPGGPGHNADPTKKTQPLMSKFKPQKALFTTGPRGTEKENMPEHPYERPEQSFANNFSNGNFSLEGIYNQRPIQPHPGSTKRKLLDAAPIHESGPLKKAKFEETSEEDFSRESPELPPPESFQPLVDDGGKPSHSYAQLIGMSILRAPNRRLTLAQIYKWISDTFSFYGATDAGWQNSIRHNLSLNKAFVKQERPKDDPGKGNYWAIEQGMESQFLKEKTTRKSNGLNENAPIMTTNFNNINMSDPVQYKPPTPAPQAQEFPPPPTYNLPEAQLPPIPELSSDATIPASDSFQPELDQHDADDLPPSSPLIQSSPPAPMMHSSPPVPRHAPRRRTDTPPPVPRFPSSSRSRSHKRKFASMDDSGYFSSLDSSAMRPHGVGRLLTSGIKRGRAEEEIARIRGSSYDSPSKGRLMSGLAAPSSSPLRRPQTNDGQMLPPLTPIIKLKPPTRAPPTASPNTNLQLHRDRVREMVGSPLRGSSFLSESVPWSPAFNIDPEEAHFNLQDFNADFDVFADASLGLLGVPGNGSPEKRSAKRPRLDRSKSANILAELSNGHFSKSATSTPMPKFTPSLEGINFNSATRNLGMMESPSKLLGIDSPSKLASSFNLATFEIPTEEEFFGNEFLTDEIADFGGMDIMQGFQKIGSGAQSTRNMPKPSSRPNFGRSLTSRF